MTSESQQILKLYGTKASTNVFRVMFYLDEKKLPYEFVDTNLMTGEHKTEEFLSRNPRGQVPCLVDGDVVVYESMGIIQYLEHKNPCPPLYPTGDLANLAICFTRIHEFQQKLDPKNISGSVVFRGVRRPEIDERAEALITELKVWDGYLQDKEYLAGTFSIADIAVFAFLVPFAELLGLEFNGTPKLKAWYERCKQRERCAFDSITKSEGFQFFASKEGIDVLKGM